MSTFYLILSVIVLSLTLLVTRIDWIRHLTGIEDYRDEYDLLIAVLSSRENYEERMALRNTWLSMSTELRVKHLFVVGQHSCPIHPADRTSQYNCHPMPLKHTPNDDIHYSTSAKGQLISGLVYTTLRFQVHHQVLLSKLGISTSKLDTAKRTTVTLAEASRQFEVGTAEFSTLTNHVVVDGFAYRPIEAIILPKGFEGVLFIQEEEHNETKCNEFSEERRVMDDGGGIITFDMVEDVHGVVKKFSDDVIVSVSMAFSIYDVAQLAEHLKERESRQRTWMNTVDQIDHRLTHEMLKYNDIELVNVVDVYRHLPQKLLTFSKTAVDKFRFHFLLKTDDDTFIHLAQLSHHLKGLINRVDGVWLGKFRCNWMVERWGKWKEDVYASAVYPCFACGSASVLSRNLVQWLANNAQHLHSFQGEDVSLGIWLSPLAPTLLEDVVWQCEEGCVNNSISRGQLSLQQMTHTWKCLLTTQHLCC